MCPVMEQYILHGLRFSLPGIFEYLDQFNAPAGIDDDTGVVAANHWDQ